MRLTNLFEDANKDVDIDRIIGKATYAIMQAAYDRIKTDRMTIRGKSYPFYWLYTLPGVDRVFHNTLVAFSTDLPKATPAAMTQLNQSKLWVVLVQVPSEDPSDIASAVNRTAVVGHIKHELHHVYDLIRNNEGVNGRNNDYDVDKVVANDPAETSRYYNTPTEYNSYFFGLADTLIMRINDLRDGGIDMLGLYDPLPEAFKEALPAILKQAKKPELRAMNHFSTETNRRFVKRLYKLFALFREEKMKAIKDAEKLGTAGADTVSPARLEPTV